LLPWDSATRELETFIVWRGSWVPFSLTTLEAGRKAIEAIKQVCKDIGLPEKLRDIGVTEDKIPEMATLAFESNYNRWNPRHTTVEDFLLLFKKAL
jgi:alcohol dehydrogenase